jgi:serine/threonine-protein kinase
MDPPKPSRETVLLELARIGASSEFRGASRLREFLQFITEETLAGREERIKEYSIGISVYRKDASYDPRLDSTVRVEAAKLRSRLELYYEQSGRDDPVRVSVPKGGYVPRFETAPSGPASPPLENPGGLPSIAVLPFLNLSPEPGDEYFSDGLVEELTAALTRSGMVCVAPRTAAFWFKNMHPEWGEVQRILNVERVLEGSVRKYGERLRITVQLVDVPGSRQLWSQTYDRMLPDVFAIQEEIAREVVSLVCGGESRGAPVRHHTPTTEAFDLYLRGRHLVHRWDLAAEQQALNLFEQAIVADPEYPLPYVGVAEALVCLATMGFAPPVDLLPRINAALEKALQLDPGSAEAHATRATVLARHEWDWASAEREYRLAIQLAPVLARAHHDYATELLAPNGRYEEAHAESRCARELDPFSPAIAYGYPWILLFQRRFVECEQEFRRLLAAGAVYEVERVGVAFALLGQGRYRESLDEYQEITGCYPSPVSDCMYTWILALSGEKGEARRRARELDALSTTRYVPASFLASVHFALGDMDLGFELLERAVGQKEPALRSLKETFDWDPIRPDPRFQTLLKMLWPKL